VTSSPDETPADPRGTTPGAAPGEPRPATAPLAPAGPAPEQAERVVFFSDAVVAIAITLLALDLPVPATTDSTTNGQLLHALGAQWPAYLAFFISFSVIGNHWADHRRVFRHAVHVNARVTSLNMLWLLMMVLTPFAARLLASNGAFGVRFTIYALIQIIAVACQAQASRELRQSRLLRSDVSGADLRHDMVRNIIFIAVFIVSIPVSFATHWAFAVWAAVPLGMRAWRAFQTVSDSPAAP
jgi:uncharacterized membrane protein